VYLRAGSIKCHFLEQPLHDVYLFITKLAKLKVLYDAATQVAVQKASEIERMRFDISVKSPILVFPSNSATSRDVLTMRLGEITARNSYEATVDRISASLQGIRLASTIFIGEQPSTLNIIDDINVSAEIIQTSGIDRSKDLDYPDTQVCWNSLKTNQANVNTQIIVRISDVGLHLTKVQYLLLLELSQSIPRVLAAAPKGDIQAQYAMSPSSSVELSDLVPSPPSDEPLVDLRPEIRPSSGTDGKRNFTAMDVTVSVGTVKLHMYDALANTEADLEDHGIARLALINSSLRLKMLSDGSLETQVILKSFTMSNTRVGSTKFREIFPAAQHDRDQIMLLFTMSSGAQASSLAVLTIDSPRIIFAVDPIFGLMEFFTIADKAPEYPDEQSADDAEKLGAIQGHQSSIMEFRVELHELSVIVLENDADPSSDSIQLTINHILLSQQVRPVP
jgi:vacuolar protein sorting-associated protein 13A/C